MNLFSNGGPKWGCRCLCIPVLCGELCHLPFFFLSFFLSFFFLMLSLFLQKVYLASESKFMNGMDHRFVAVYQA